MISARDPEALPHPRRLRAICQSLAVLDEIMESVPEFRYFTYCSRWWEDWDFAEMRDGEGDEYFIVFAPAGVLIRGYHNDLCPVRYSDAGGEAAKQLDARLFAGLPASLEEARRQLANIWEVATFAVWRETTDDRWHVGQVLEGKGDDPDGSEELLWMLDDDPATYAEWAKDYWGREVDRSLIERVYRHETITEELILGLNPDAHVDEVMTSAEAMGFTTSRKKAGDDVPSGGTSDPKK